MGAYPRAKTTSIFETDAAGARLADDRVAIFSGLVADNTIRIRIDMKRSTVSQSMVGTFILPFPFLRNAVSFDASASKSLPAQKFADDETQQSPTR
jgi:hypothetical protein